MMLYVFIVSSGTMMKFEMNLAVKKVIELKNEIARRVNISQGEQVLLCSGGEELQSDNIVGNYYGAGTDTNPIFLFSKYANEMAYPSQIKTSIDMSIADDVEGCSKMSPSVGAATVKSSLAQRFAESAVSGRRECDELVHSQHLQQQGWAAVIANLEDFKDSLLKRKVHFEELYHKYLIKRSSYLETIYLFPRSIELLAKIPLLPKLIIENDCSEDDLNTKHTLLSWFISEPPDVLESLVEKCQRLLEELNEHTIIALNEDFLRILKSVDNTDIKEVKGIEERLSKLNSKIEKAKKYEKDQRDLATWFTQYQGMIAADPQVLPDLCSTFQKQLEIMLENHKCLRNILDLCTKAKLELSENINARLKYIAKAESDMYQLQMQIMLYESHVQSVISQVESYHQVQLAPHRYLKLLAEVCRRKVFSARFMKWAKELSSQASKLYYKELNLRKSFISSEEKNMVDNLFPGMSDEPPPFAVECPAAFDQCLPDIVKEDLEWLKINFPHLSHFCEVIPPDPLPYISQEGSDSAFSSNIPSSHVVSASLSEKTSTKGDLPTGTLTVPFTDYSSLPSEYTSLPNKVFSLTSSPFEDPLLPSHMQEERTKTLLLSGKSVSGECVGGTDSDGEGFETVDPYRTSPDVTTSLSNQGTRARPTSSSDVIEINTLQKLCPKITKARSDGDALSPMQERLKSSDSLGMSVDFQNAEYYIDDSMPSSYSESNATSPRNRMVKSHHVVISELQKQVDEKNGALSITKKNSLEHANSYIMKLHAKLSALQKFIQELQANLGSDLSNLKAFVKEELCSRMVEFSEVVNYINTYVVKVEQQMIHERELAISEIKEECSSVEKEFLRKLEIEAQKLTDAENQIAFYEDNLRSICSSYEETKQEKELLDASLQDKNELIKRMMLEHELEYDSFKNSIKETLHSQEAELKVLKQNLSDAHTEIKRLEDEKVNFEKESYKHHSLLASLQDQQKQLENEILRLQEENQNVKQFEETNNKFRLLKEENAQYAKELKKAKDALSDHQEEMEKLKAAELKDLETKLNEKYKNDLESLISRFKFALSSTSEKSSCSTDSCDTESLSCLKELQQIVLKNREELVRSLKEGHEKEVLSLKESVEDTFLKHEEEKIQIIEALRLKHENTLEKLTSRITAENQVSFNEAINSLAKEKDSIIENLRSRISVLEAKQCAIQAYLGQYPPSLSTTAVAEGAMAQSECGISSSSAVQQLIDENRCFLKFKTDLEALLQLTDTTKPPYQHVRYSSESCECLRKMSLSTSTNKQSCLPCANRVSILTCEPGEIVLVCYEEKLEHYIIFHLGNHLHFLHSDSVAALDLKLSAGGTQKWAIGTVVHKEFCVTKKVNNRFKLSLGTKFFRVKVEKWNGHVIATRTTSAPLPQSVQTVASSSASLQQSVQTVAFPSALFEQSVASTSQSVSAGVVISSSVEGDESSVSNSVTQ